MGFFTVPVCTPAPPVQQPNPPWPVWMKPEAVLPGIAAGEQVLARTGTAVVELGSMWAYSNGFEVEINVRLRRAESGAQSLDPHLINLYHRARLRGQPAPMQPPHDFLRFGVLYADGRVATNMDPRPLPPPEIEPSSPLLFPVLVGGGGHLRRAEIRYWIWSLPPSGPLTFVCEWPAQAIAETRTTIDSDPILDAARRSFELWPEEPDSPDELHHRLAS
jgi:hypothetical protein